jgi:hypothetical protein
LFWNDLMLGNDFSTFPQYFYVVVTQKPKIVANRSASHCSIYGKQDAHHQIQLVAPRHTQGVVGGPGKAMFDQLASGLKPALRANGPGPKTVKPGRRTSRILSTKSKAVAARRNFAFDARRPN